MRGIVVGQLLPDLVRVALADRLGGEEESALSQCEGGSRRGALGLFEYTLLAARPLPFVLTPFMAAM
jgi:hypothetical protein